jgi:SAM-dependent methyltransferase
MARQMARGRRWLVAALALAAAVTVATSRGRGLARLVGNLRRYSAPSASLYDAASSLLLRRFFIRVAGELADLAPRAHVLEIGSGPGRLAVILAEVAPEVRVTGVDVTPDMVERATTLAAGSGVAGQVRFLVGDVAALPLPDATFDLAVSTFSAHHWPDPARGLAEIYRVLRPGGVARIYDLAGWLRQVEQHGPGVAELAADSPFGEHGAHTHTITRLGPIPLVDRTELSRKPPGPSG